MSEHDVEVITVRGEAAVPADPDEVGLWFTVTSIRPVPDEALADVATRSVALDALFEERGIARAKRSTSGVSVHEHREYVEERRVRRGYEAANTIAVRLDDASTVGDLMRAAIERAEAQVRGPSWRIALDNPAHDDARRAAAADARRRAEVYAEAAGVRLGPIVELRELGAGSRFAQERGIAVAASSLSEPDLDVHPGELEVRAGVEVSFRIERG